MGTARPLEHRNRDPIAERVAKIRLLLLDVDGVLTDGSIIYSDHGEEVKHFHVRDGSGLKFWRDAGNRVAVLSGRSSQAVTKRAAELQIDPVVQGRNDKRTAWHEILQATGFAADQVCMVGDDLPDLPVMLQCGVSATVADAAPEVMAAADYVSPRAGGRGAVRDIIEWLLKGQGHWDNLLGQFHDQG